MSAYYLFIKWKETIGNILILFFTAVATVITNDFLIVFIASLLAWIMVFNSRELLKHIDRNFLKKSPSNNISEKYDAPPLQGS
ncbi:hypothetical protein HRF69_24625 [Bacillus circulans]|nr:hypothetical protein [Niallia circulans]